MENKATINALGIIGLILGVISFFMFGWLGLIGAVLSLIGYALHAEKITPTISLILNLITGIGWAVLFLPYLFA